MASTFLLPTVIARAAVALLLRELVLSRTIWTDAVAANEFRGAYNDTVTLRVPARTTADTRVLRAGTPIVPGDLHEFGVPVQLDTDVYKGINVTDENLTLSIRDFGEQILMPQITAVAEKLEDIIEGLIVGASYESDMTIDADDHQTSSVNDWYKIANRARRLLNEQHVPRANRYLVVGTAIEEEILNNDKFIRNDSIGQSAESALREATIGRIAGFTVVPSAGIPETDAYAYHKTAFVLGAMAPRVPAGATMGEVRSLGQGQQAGAQQVAGGVGVRWLMDYDALNTTDRSLVSTWVGTAEVTDPDDPTDSASTKSLIRAVRISGGGSSS